MIYENAAATYNIAARSHSTVTTKEETGTDQSVNTTKKINKSAMVWFPGNLILQTMRCSTRATMNGTKATNKIFISAVRLQSVSRGSSWKVQHTSSRSAIIMRKAND
jgi:hypothetical protein